MKAINVIANTRCFFYWRTLVKTGFLGFLVTVGTQMSGQERKVAYSNQQWAQYYLQAQLTGKWSVLADVGGRRQNSLRDWAQTLIRGGASYRVNEGMSLAVGLAYFTFYQNNAPARDEVRPWIELAFKQVTGRITWQHRLRSEERFFHTFSTSSDNSNYRGRYRFFITIPINHASLKENTWFLAGGDEVFINFGKEINYNMFDQNRVLAGFGYKLNEAFQFSLSYVYQYAQKNKALTFEETEIFWLSINHKISFSKPAAGKNSADTEPQIKQ